MALELIDNIPLMLYSLYMYYTAPDVRSTEPESRTTASGQTAFSGSTTWAACVLLHHEVEGRDIQWACSFVVSETTTIKPP